MDGAAGMTALQFMSVSMSYKSKTEIEDYFQGQLPFGLSGKREE